MDIHEAAKRLGIDAVGLGVNEVRNDLASMLLALEKDVDGDQDIDDGHVRFGEHVAVMALAGQIDAGFEARMDTMFDGSDAEANAFERQGIALVRARFL